MYVRTHIHTNIQTYTYYFALLQEPCQSLNDPRDQKAYNQMSCDT